MGMRNIAPFGLRMPAELRDKLEVAAKASRRSLNSEILERLACSLVSQAVPVEPGDATVIQAVSQPQASYFLPENDYELQLVAAFRRLTPDKQLALLTLIR